MSHAEGQGCVGQPHLPCHRPGGRGGPDPLVAEGWAKEEPLRSWMLVRTFGWLLVCLGALVLIQAFAHFVREGLGTPAPVAPTKRLVVGGLYRYVRNARCMDVAEKGRSAAWAVVLLRGICGSWRVWAATSGAGYARDEMSRRSICQIHMTICRAFTGATGLEPANSGVIEGGPARRCSGSCLLTGMRPFLGLSRDTSRPEGSTKGSIPTAPVDRASGPERRRSALLAFFRAL